MSLRHRLLGSRQCGGGLLERRGSLLRRPPAAEGVFAVVVLAVTGIGVKGTKLAAHLGKVGDQGPGKVVSDAV